jgi:hypothetical protein
MSRKNRGAINRANAQKSTGPKSPEGKKVSAFNAIKHNLTGQSLILQPNEFDAYDRLTKALREELNPKTELERQTVQKIIDTNFRLNRIAGIENNMLNFGLWENQQETESGERLDVMKAQTGAWMQRAKSFDLLGRYESRLTKQLLLFTRELERLQGLRKAEAASLAQQKLAQLQQMNRDNPDLASFGNTPSTLVMSATSDRLPPLPPPARLRIPATEEAPAVL